MKKVTLTVREGLDISIGGWAYLSLLLLALVVLDIGYRKYRSPFLFVLYLAVSGAILFFDYLIYVWGKAYKYHPGFIEGKYDTHIGDLLMHIFFRLLRYYTSLFGVNGILSFCTFLIAMLVLLYGSIKMEEHNGRI
jgi:hypothetical protein